MSQPNIVLGLITCRNIDGLRKLVTHIAAADLAGVSRFVLVDNDPSGSARDALSDLDLTVLPDVEYFHEPNPGIPFARNRVLTEAMTGPFDFIAMLDDDEYPTPSWLSELVRRASESEGHIIGGKVIPALETPAVDPIRDSDYQHQMSHRVNGRDFVGATSNVLISRVVVETFQGAWFSPAYAMTGGSDTEFFRRVFDAGYLHQVAPTSIAYEDIPASRLKTAWLLKRAYRFGNGITRVRIETDGAFATAMSEGFRICGLFGRYLVRRLASTPSLRNRLEQDLMLARIRGKIDAFRGQSYDEYAQSNYRG